MNSSLLFTTIQNSGTVANRNYHGRTVVPLNKKKKMCDHILVTLLKMEPHYSQSNRENATPSSGTSPLASYKEVPPSPPGHICMLVKSNLFRCPADGGWSKVFSTKKKRRLMTLMFSVKKLIWREICSTNSVFIVGINKHTAELSFGSSRNILRSLRNDDGYGYENVT